jgi:hypothetical protein
MINQDLKHLKVKEPINWLKIIIDGFIFGAVVALIAAVLLIGSAQP